MPNWPDQDETLINDFVKQLNLACYSAPYRSVLRRFQRFVTQRSRRPGFPKSDLVQDMLRSQRRPYIYTVEEVRRLLETARHDPAPRAPLRSPTLYAMLVLAYCSKIFSVTVSSNEAQRILILKTLTQQVLNAISPAD
jgi:hypothetical protein